MNKCESLCKVSLIAEHFQWPLKYKETNKQIELKITLTAQQMEKRALNQIQQKFLMKTLQKLETQETFLDFIKDICENTYVFSAKKL